MSNERGMYYYDPAVIDLGKMRDDAYRKSQGDDRNEPEDVTVHYHKWGEKCNDSCERYPAKAGTEEEGKA